MNYELALKLKEAGFPQFPDNRNGFYLYDSDGFGTEQVYVPTLSELIEACKLDSFFQLTFMSSSGKWSSEFDSYHGKGSTPEEAVANLYLALNQK